MMMKPEEMRKRFHENRAERERILAKSEPMRKERDDLLQAYEPRVRELERQIKEVEQQGNPSLYDLDQEAAMISRALGGKTGKAE